MDGSAVRPTLVAVPWGMSISINVWGNVMYNGKSEQQRHYGRIAVASVGGKIPHSQDVPCTIPSGDDMTAVQGYTTSSNDDTAMIAQ